MTDSFAEFDPRALAHLLRLREALWAPFETRASVMVGAGFSRNATPLDGARGPIPDWHTLAERLLRELAPSPDDQKSLRGEMGSVSEGYMRLAQYYEAEFERPALDRFIADAISDSFYEPGALHEQLLNLPWREVFTTNWDTLLERAADTGVQQLYFPVRDDAQILTSGRPRIVKLHGCVQHGGNYIFTEEDYRTYPHKHPVFVTVVRQALLEGPLMLVGFSGEDPNFRSWVGWMRDVLASTHPVYLLDLASTDAASYRARRLDAQGIITVRVGRSGDDPATSIKRVLDFLGDPPKNEWPSAHTRIQSSGGFQAMAPTVVDANRSYPGWLICPRLDRSRLVHRVTQAELSDSTFDGVALTDRLAFYAARARLLELLGTGLLDEEVGRVDAVLTDATADLKALGVESAEHWLALAFSRLAHARLNLDFPGYRGTRNLMLAASSLRGIEWRNELTISDALMALLELDVDRALTLLRSVHSADPHLQLRCLVLRMELDGDNGLHSDLEALKRKVARLVRKRPDDVRYASLEDAVRYLEHRRALLSASGSWTAPPPPDDASDARSKRLLGLRCDIRSELFFLETILEYPPMRFESGVRVHSGFGAGTWQTDFHFDGKLPPGLIPAYLMARCPDEVGLLIANNHGTLLVKALEHACDWLSSFDPPAGLALVLRLLASGHRGQIKKLSRLDLARFGQPTVSHVWPCAIDAINRELARHRPSKQQGERLTGLVALLSKLVVRVDSTEGLRLWNLIFDKVWPHVTANNTDLRVACVDALAEASRLLLQKDISLTLKIKVSEILDRPATSESDAEFLLDVSNRVDLDPQDAPDPALVDRLVLLLSFDDLPLRKIGIFLIAVLQRVGAISTRDRGRVGDALWHGDKAPPDEFSRNAAFLAAWSGHRKSTVRARFVQQIMEASDSATIIRAANALAWRDELETQQEWHDSISWSDALVESVRNAVIDTARTYRTMLGFSQDGFERAWRNALGRFLAPLHAINGELLREAIEQSKSSDLWAPSLIVELFRFGLVREADLADAILRWTPTTVQFDWNVSDSILEILTSPDAAFADLQDRSVFLNELTHRIKSVSGPSSAHAMWVAKRILERRPDIVPRIIQSIWLLAVCAVARKSYASNADKLIEVLPDLRWASASLLTALCVLGLIHPNDSTVVEARTSFLNDHLPEVRDAVADWPL